MLDDFAEFDQQMYLNKVGCPILVINGDGDSEELMLKEIASRALHFLPAGSHHEILSGAEHNFLRHLDQIIDLGLSWLMDYMPIK